ncbi:hypothetical protein [Bradyrhizobium sp. RDI18]|uniref:AMP-binding enzyme n=1 Tax=Bradyrhizobium sp. RDI18 TaxID=3367400 RepID=UPI00371EDC0A
MRIDKRGGVWIVGRNKDLIITGGHNVYSREVEATLSRFSAVRDCAVIGVPHPDFGEGVIAVVELGGKAATFDVKSTIADLAHSLLGTKFQKRSLSCLRFREMQWAKFRRTSSRRGLRLDFSGNAKASK